MSNKVHVVLVLDRSGSMASVVPATIAGVNEMIDSLKRVAKDTNQEITASFIGFESAGYGSYIRGPSPRYSASTINPGHEFMAGYEDVSLSNLKHVTTNEIYGGGGTEMNKAILFGIESLKHKKQNVLFCIFTDGQTSDGLLFTEAAAAIDAQQRQHWTFAFIGANQDAAAIAKQLSIPESNAMTYTSDMVGTRNAFYRLNRGVRKYLEKQAKPQFDTGLYSSTYQDFFNDDELKLSKMKVNGLEMTLNLPESVKSEDEKENVLPPYAPVAAYVVDEYPACPANWMHGSGKASSYFVAVKEGQGMWFDFNGNNDNEYDIAAVISVQGVNPITGQRTSELRLERYENKCPVHDKEFHQDRFCTECKFKWPAQNYIATTGTPDGQFWVDGFRSEDGKVRQYVFTEEMARGVANAIIGTDRVFAIGVAFFKSKAKKPVDEPQDYFSRGVVMKCSTLGSGGPSGSQGPSGQSLGRLTRSYNKLDSFYGGDIVACSAPKKNLESTFSLDQETDEVAINGSLEAVTPTKSYEVAAGAKIDQKLHEDPNQLSYWEDEPAGVLYINYADVATVEKILKAGKRKEAKEGFLSAVPVGN